MSKKEILHRFADRRTQAAWRDHSRRLSASLTAMIVVLVLMPTVLGQTAANYVIGGQDVLSITVFGQSDLSGRFTVEMDGTFSFPLLGRVTAANLTIRQFEAELRKLLADGFLKNPQVSVTVEQYRSQRIFIVGEVRQPGTYPLTGGMTLIEALARAGSTLPSASGEVLIVRARDPKAVSGPTLPALGGGANPEVTTVDIRRLQSGELSKNPELTDGDTIFVPQAANVYVFGEVKSPGSYPIKVNTTVLQALSLAGGATQLAALNRIKIVRIVAGDKRELKAKLTDIVAPGDTIIVPERFF